MDPYRKLLVLATNELIGRGLIKFERDRMDYRGERGEVEAVLAGEYAIIQWLDVSLGELRISVWWKCDHALAVRADLEEREQLVTGAMVMPAAEADEMIGITASAWFELKAGKYLHGKGRDGIFDASARTEELQVLEDIPDPEPAGYSFEADLASSVFQWNN